jgi:hypothetical protein
MLLLRDLIYQETEYEADFILNKCNKNENCSDNNSDVDDDESFVTTADVADEHPMDDDDELWSSDLLLDPLHEAAIYILTDAELNERHHRFLVIQQQQQQQQQQS